MSLLVCILASVPLGGKGRYLILAFLITLCVDTVSNTGHEVLKLLFMLK